MSATVTPSLKGCFEPLETEHSYWVEDIEGDLPEDLVGTFYRNGPGRLRLNGQWFGHWFDGDGMIAATTFTGKGKGQSGRRVHFKNRFVRTRKFVEETRKQKILYRGMGTQIPGGMRKNMFRNLGNPANTSLLLNHNKLLALWEGGSPHALDPATLETFGEYSFEHALKPGQPFAAHGKLNAKTGKYYTFGATIKGVDRKGFIYCFYVFEVNPNGSISRRQSFRLKQFPFFHDCAITENYAVFFLGSVTYSNIGKVALGLATGAEGIRFNDNMPCEVLVVDLRNMSLVQTFSIDPMMVVHFGNSYEQEGKLYVEGWRATDFAANEQLSRFNQPDFDLSKAQAEFYQWEIDLGRHTISGKPLAEGILNGEFPQWDQRRTCYPHRYVYTAALCDQTNHQFFNAIQKIDRDTGQVKVFSTGDYRFNGEPLFAPRQGSEGEDDGYVLAYVYDGHKDRSEVVVIDAKTMEQRAAVKFFHPIPQGFHGLFTPRVFVES